MRPQPSLIPALHAIQDHHGWLPREELEALSRATKRPLYEIQGLISFYPHFRTKPPPPVSVAVCDDLPCWLAGDPRRFATVQQAHGSGAEVRRVSCLGRCDGAPAMQVDEQVLPRTQLAPGERWPSDPYTTGSEHYRTLRRIRSGELAVADVITVLSESGLRGMGGAGFPTGVKWRVVRDEPGQVKYAICNADESEPGTFKDREILATQPHLVVEGLLIGMVAVGASEGWIFIRHEYGPEEDALRAELGRAAETGLLEGFAVDIFTSPGGYILGEETALIECMEGHRGEPRNKPPFPGQVGLWGRPTLINNVETFAQVPGILDRGSHAWKFFAVSGDVESPGVHCVPAGTTTARELLDLCGGVKGGRALLAFQPGGASSNFLGPGALDVPLDFGPLQDAGSMLGSGAVVFLAEGRDLLAAATNVLRFFRDESCGKCVPCRVGSHKAHELMETRGFEARGAVTQLEETLRMTSICGLGQVALGPLMSALRLLDASARG